MKQREKKQYAPIGHDDAGIFRMFRRIVMDSTFELKGEAVLKAASLTQWFLDLEERFLETDRTIKALKAELEEKKKEILELQPEEPEEEEKEDEEPWELQEEEEDVNL